METDLKVKRSREYEGRVGYRWSPICLRGGILIKLESGGCQGRVGWGFSHRNLSRDMDGVWGV